MSYFGKLKRKYRYYLANYQSWKWKSALYGDHLAKCPPVAFLKTSSNLRDVGEVKKANQIITRGIEIYPKDLLLAIEAAEVSTMLNDDVSMTQRWENVIVVGQTKSPAKAYKILADCYFKSGNLTRSEEILRRGLSVFANDFSLEQKLGKPSLEAGFSLKAIEHWEALLAHHPNHSNGAWIYQLIHDAYCDEGLFDRARETLEAGIIKYPESAGLLINLVQLDQSMDVKSIRSGMSETVINSIGVQATVSHIDNPTSVEESIDDDCVVPDVLKILIILPSSRLGASARYIQTLSVSLIQLGCKVMVIAEGGKSTSLCGVQWRTLAFEGTRLSSELRQEIVEFSPHIIYENGVRSRAQRAALEALILTKARFAMQSEDDDRQVCEAHHGKDAAEHLISIDHPKLEADQVVDFLKNNDWKLSLNILLDPSYDRWVEPILRVLCYRLASLHTAIWYPFEERLSREYGVPTLVVPPVATASDFERMMLSTKEKLGVRDRYGIESDRVIFFIGGAVYDYSDEFAIFLEALNRVVETHSCSLALVVSSSRSKLPVADLVQQHLSEKVRFIDMKSASDSIYMEMLKTCDIVCSPGVPDTFNRYRMPSRLVKAMAMSIPILTCKCGFGESLENGVNAFLTDGCDPKNWAETIIDCLDSDRRLEVGARGQLFARDNFDSDRVAAALKNKFMEMMAEPRRTLSLGSSI